MKISVIAFTVLFVLFSDFRVFAANFKLASYCGDKQTAELTHLDPLIDNDKKIFSFQMRESEILKIFLYADAPSDTEFTALAIVKNDKIIIDLKAVAGGACEEIKRHQICCTVPLLSSGKYKIAIYNSYSGQYSGGGIKIYSGARISRSLLRG